MGNLTQTSVVQPDQYRLKNHKKRLSAALREPELNENRNLYGEMLDGQDWNFWFTATFRPDFGLPTSRYVVEDRDRGLLDLPACRRQAVRMYRRIRPDRFFFGTESGCVNGRNHLHGLIAWERYPNWTERDIFNYLFDNFGRAQVDRYDPALGACHYVSKYVSKDLADFDIFRKPKWKR